VAALNLTVNVRFKAAAFFASTGAFKITSHHT
jgi:hypothetical protein